MTGVPSSSRRFEIALSFPGEHRGVVEKVAGILASKFTSEQILYDEYHDAEFSAPDLDIYLPPLYLDDSELIVVFLCQEYAEKTWCKLEWRNIRQMIGRADARRIMFLSFGKLGRIPELGILEGDGKLDITEKTPELIAQKILKRLDLNRGITPSTSISALPPNTGPIHLPQPRLGNLFTGREDDIKNLTTSHFIGPHHPGEKPLVLYGPPGVGKTTLACELLYHLHDAHLLSHILHIPAADPAALPTLLADLALKVGAISAGQGPVDPAAAHLAFCQWLTKPDITGKALLYFDNADTPAARDAVLAEIKALGFPRALVTSRRNDWRRSNLHSVHDWTPQQVVEYLSKCLPQLSRPDVERLTTALGGLPLAFELVAALVKTRHFSVPGLLKQWKTKLSREKIVDRDGSPSIAALIAISLESLEVQSLLLLRIFSHYGYHPIPQILPESTYPQDWREFLHNLVSSSLLSWNENEKTISLHPFLGSAVYSSIPEDSRDFLLGCALNLLGNNLPPPEWTTGGWGRWQALLPHVIALADCAEQFLHAMTALKPDSAVDLAQIESLPFIMAQTSSYYHHQGHFKASESLMRRALPIVRAIHGPNHPNFAICLTNLAQALFLAGNFEDAEPLLREALRINEMEFGSDNLHLTSNLSALGGLLKRNGCYDEAESYMRRVIHINRSSLDAEPPDIAKSLNNLAMLLEATDRNDEAEKLFREALSIDEAYYNGDHPEISARLNNLGQLLKKTGRFSEAEPLMRRALKIERKTSGPKHPNVAMRHNNLARLFQDTGRLAAAEPHSRRHLWIMAEHARNTGTEHPHYSGSVTNFIGVLQNIGYSPDEIQKRVASAIEEEPNDPE